MKATIDGKRYDTETATLVAKADNGLSYSDFNAWDEKLYLTKKGAWFLVGSGGPNSRYAKSYSGGSSGSSKLIPFTKEEAFAWLQENDCSKEIDQYFADWIEEA